MFGGISLSTSEFVEDRVNDVDTVKVGAPVELATQGTLRRKRSFLASVSCFFSLSALLLIVGTPPIGVLAAPIGVTGGIVSYARIRSAPTEPLGRGMAIAAIGIGGVALALSLMILVNTQAT